MKLRFLCTLLLFCTAFAAAAATLQIKTVNPRAIQPCGKTATFKVSVLDDQGNPVTSGNVLCQFQTDHFEKISEVTIDLAKENPFHITGTLKEPGFLRCDVQYEDLKDFAVTAFDPFQIKATQTLPPDFQEFWAKAKADALKIPLDVKLEKLDRLSSRFYTGYSISFANINGTRMYGYLSVPTAPGPHPAGIIIPGAGQGFTKIGDDYPLSSTIVLVLNVHPYAVEPETAKERYKELNKEQHYYFHGLPDLQKYVFYRVVLGLCRGVKYLTERPDWDGKHLLVTGSSQGGGLTILTAALNADVVSAAAVNVPAFGEMVPGVRPPQNNWSKIRALPEGERITSYLDAVNFAPMIRCPMIWSVGWRDQSCYPRAVLAAYNRLTSDKFIWIGPEMVHTVDPQYNTFRKLWLAQQLIK
ncbi:MAG: acetylxylan esterase [Lentisphaeria bacterium]|nr:acetylxylan esterase [Lentisphaeria bacterium]